jgi:ribosomal protein S18 acetylase RimI-like enzyme
MQDDKPDPNSIEIVSSTPDQWETYREIRLRGLLEEPQAFPRTYEEAKAFPQEKWLQRASNPHNFIAIENGIPLGTMGALISDESGNKIATIIGVFVARDARGKGIGTRLLRAVLDKIKQDPTIRTVKLSVNKDQIPAVNLYKKFGFKITGEKIEKLGDGKDHLEYLMELVL